MTENTQHIDSHAASDGCVGGPVWTGLQVSASTPVQEEGGWGPLLHHATLASTRSILPCLDLLSCGAAASQWPSHVAQHETAPQKLHIAVRAIT